MNRRSQIPAALLSLATCAVGIWFSARVGHSRMVEKYAQLTGNVYAADSAIAGSPLDAQAHQVRARLLYNAGEVSQAAKELEVAVSLRPRDDYLWLQLGIIRDELQQSDALAAFDEAVRFAPYYAHPKWQRGNFLLRSGRYDEAFGDLRDAASSNQDLVPSLIDLAWGVSQASPTQTVAWAGISNDQMRIAFAMFLARTGRAKESLEQFRSSKIVSLQARRDLLHELISGSAFREAHEIWLGMEHEGDDGGVTTMHDGDFEDSRPFDNTGFGWRFSQATQGVRLSLDETAPHAGRQSLHVAYLGYSEPATAVLSQLLLVEPEKRYRVAFAARTEQMVTGGLPLITLTDAGNAKALLGQSSTLGSEHGSWRTVSFDFQTGQKTEAVELRLVRKQCNSAPCPIFGSLWLDSFSLAALK
jgi:tetratricopeptide (TPR) repeat protein